MKYKLIVLVCLVLNKQVLSQKCIDIEKLEIDSFPKLFYFYELNVEFIGKYKFNKESNYKLQFDKIFVYDDVRKIINCPDKEYKTDEQRVNVSVVTKDSGKIIKQFIAKVSNEVFIKIESNLYNDIFMLNKFLKEGENIYFTCDYETPLNYKSKLKIIEKHLKSFEVEHYINQNGKYVLFQKLDGWYDNCYTSNSRGGLYFGSNLLKLSKFCFINKFEMMSFYKNLKIQFKLTNKQPECIDWEQLTNQKKPRKRKNKT